jgi:hypothetical protein
MRPPRFQRKDVFTCMGSTTARGSSSASHLRGEDVAFPEAELGRHLEIGPVSQLNTQPVITPVNASRLASRPETRASLRAGAIGYILPREGLAPPILSPTCLAHTAVGHDREVDALARRTDYPLFAAELGTQSEPRGDGAVSIRHAAAQRNVGPGKILTSR